MLVTDAMPSVGGTKDRFLLYGREIIVAEGRCVTAGGTLAGSNIDMATAVRNCVSLLGAPLEDALRFASRSPAEFLGFGDSLGRIAPGYRADLVALEPEPVRVIGAWIGGNA
jgi:N-acetylglucosamine-6-phosphate deacetylase